MPYTTTDSTPSHTGLRALRARWIEVVVTLVVTISQLWDVILAGSTRVIANPDTQLHYWTLWWWSRALATNPLEVWHAPQFAPYPYTLAYSDHFAAFGVFCAPLIWLGVPIGLLLNGAVIASAVATVWAVRALARDAGAARWPALLVGLAVGFGAFRTTQLAHLQMLATWMLPLAVLWFGQAMRAPHVRSWPAFGFLMVVASAFGLSIYHGFMLVPVLGIACVVLLVHTPPSQRISFIKRLLVFGCISCLALLPSLWPYLQVQRTTAVVRSLDELANWSAPLQAWFAVPAQHPLWPPVLGDVVTGRPELVLAPGLLLSIAALLGFGVRNPLRWLWIMVIVGGFVLASGSVLRVWDGDAGIALPTAGIVARLPGYGALRVPARWGWLVTFGLAMLAAHGLSRPWVMTRRWPMLLATLLLMSDLSWPTIPTVETPYALPERPVYTWLAMQQTPRTILELPLNTHVESAVQAERLWWQTIHGQRTVTGYSGIAPASQVLLARDAAHLPRADVLARLAAAGADTLLVHRDTPEAQRVLKALATCKTCVKAYDAPDAVVYTIPPNALLNPSVAPGTRLWVSADARLPDLVALGSAHAWRAQGVTVEGPARERFYTAWHTASGIPDAWLLGASEEPESVGVSAADAVVQAAGAIRYRRPEGLLAAQPVAIPTGEARVTYDQNGLLRIGADSVVTSTATALTVVFDVAVETTVRVGDMSLAPGAQVLTLTIPRGQEHRLQWDSTHAAIVRVRVFDRAVTVPLLQSVPLRLDPRVEGAALVLQGVTGDVQLQGIEDATGKAVTHPIPAGDSMRIAAGVLPPLANGHYQVVVLTARGQRIVAANLWIEAGVWRWQAIPLPLTLVY
ncbi:MAG: hypothetical protein RLY87_515 [Chloroflexota bacterium]